MRDVTHPGCGDCLPFGAVSPWLHDRVGGHSPRLLADFLSGRYRSRLPRAFSTLITFSRASSATYVDSSGTIQTAAADTPRLGHHVRDGSAWDNAGLLVESAAATNLITHSEDFTDASWARENAITVTGGYAESPGGATDATRMVFAASNIARIFASVISPTTTVFSVWMKSNTGADQDVQIMLREVGFGTMYGQNIVTVTSEWQRFEVAADCSASTSGVMTMIYHYGSDATEWDILVWGAQCEAAATASSYIPTAGATVTRAADSITADLDAGTYDIRVVTDTGTTDLLSVVHAGGAYWPSQAEGAVARVLVYPEGALA